jgi:hypothetical protein
MRTVPAAWTDKEENKQGSNELSSSQRKYMLKRSETQIAAWEAMKNAEKEDGEKALKSIAEGGEDEGSRSEKVIQATTKQAKGCLTTLLSFLGLTIGRTDSGSQGEGWFAVDDEENDARFFTEDYDVRDQYYDPPNWAVKISTSDFFNYMTIFAICANAFTIYLMMDITGSTREACELAEMIFLGFYSLELLVRFCSFKEKLASFNDFWFGYDLALLVAMWVEVALVSLSLFSELESVPVAAEFVRPWAAAYRLARFIRVLRAMPSVVTIIKGITSAVRPILSTLYILGFELFCMAVVFRARFGGPPYDGPKETEAEFFLRTEDDDLIYRFRNMNESFFACLFAGVFTDNITLVMAELSKKSGPMMIVFFFHVGLTNLTLLNILIGVVTTVIQEAEDQREENDKIRSVKQTMLKHMLRVDKDFGNDNKMIGPIEFEELLKIDEVVEFLQDKCDISPKQLTLLGETMFHPGPTSSAIYKELSFGAFLKGILGLWTGKPCTAVDVIALKNDIKGITDAGRERDKNLMRHSADIHDKVDKLTAMVEALQKGRAYDIDLDSYLAFLKEREATGGAGARRLEIGAAASA